MGEPILGETLTSWGLQYSVHACPKRHKSEAEAVFHGISYENLLVVPTCQKAKMDLVNVGPDVEQEKDLLLERFFVFAKAVTGKLQAQGHWADYIDPCSGLPARAMGAMIHREGSAVYGEVDALVTLLGYKTANAGCCKVVLHPKWGSAVYPSSLFTTAPKEALLAALSEASEEVVKDLPQSK